MLHDTKQFINNIGWLLTGTILSNIISIAITISIIRKLPVEDFGIYSMFLGSLMIFSILSVNPILLSLRRFIPEMIQKKYFKYLKSLVTRLYVLSLLLGIFFIIAASCFKSQIGIVLNIDKFEIYYSLFTINIFLCLVNGLNDAILISLYEQKLVSICAILGLMIRGVLYWMFIPIITIDLIFIIEASSACVKAIPSSYVVFKRVSLLDGPETIEIPSFERRNNRERMRRFTLLGFGNEMSYGVLSEVSDFYFIAAYLGPVALGLYAFPYRLLQSVLNWIPISGLAHLIQPIFISNYYRNKQDPIYLEKMFNFLFKSYLILFGVLTTLIIAYQGLIHTYLFKSKYLETQGLLILIALFALPRSLLFPIGLVMQLKEKIQHLLYANSVAVLNLVLVVLVLTFTDWGLIGVAFSTGISNLIKICYIYFFMKRLTGIKLNILEAGKTAVMIVPFAATAVALSNLENLALRIFLPAGLGLLALYIMYRLIQPFNSEEREFSKQLMNKLPLRVPFISKIFAFNR